MPQATLQQLLTREAASAAAAAAGPAGAQPTTVLTRALHSTALPYAVAGVAIGMCAAVLAMPCGGGGGR